MRQQIKRIGAALLLAGLASMASTQAQQATVQGIYTCIDARGRTLTSDRPIAECLDREQKILNPSGTVKAKVGPTLTHEERVALEAKERAEKAERARLNEEKRRDRALLTRYPDKAVHDKERSDALAQIEVVRRAAIHRVTQLLDQRAAINQEMEFYKNDPSKAPPSLRRQAVEVANSLAVQGRFIADQDAELRRVDARFDEELVRLTQLWALQSQSTIGKTR